MTVPVSVTVALVVGVVLSAVPSAVVEVEVGFSSTLVTIMDGATLASIVTSVFCAVLQVPSPKTTVLCFYDKGTFTHAHMHGSCCLNVPNKRKENHE